MCISESSPEKQRERESDRERERDRETEREKEKQKEREREMCYEELAHMIIEAENSHDLPSARWRHRKASGIIPVLV